MQTSAHCNLCANCIETRPNDSLKLEVRWPTQELWAVARPRFEEAFLAVVIVGIVLVQNITMLSFWEPAKGWFTDLLCGSRTLAFTAVFLLAMAAPWRWWAAPPGPAAGSPARVLPATSPGSGMP